MEAMSELCAFEGCENVAGDKIVVGQFPPVGKISVRVCDSCSRLIAVGAITALSIDDGGKVYDTL